MHKFRYGIIGRGRWGIRIAKILNDYSRSVHIFDISRRKSGESKATYMEKTRNYFRQYASNVNIVWIAVPPGDQDFLVKSILELKKNIIVEKPWMCSQGVTTNLISIANNLGLQIAVHHQYCFLSALSKISQSINQIGDIVFSGEFTVSMGNRFSIPATYNLGSHLLAIKCLLFSQATIGSIRTGYNTGDRRIIKISSSHKEFLIDFLNNREPLIQRFINAFEQSITNNNEFPINLKLSLEINRELARLK